MDVLQRSHDARMAILADSPFASIMSAAESAGQSGVAAALPSTPSPRPASAASAAPSRRTPTPTPTPGPTPAAVLEDVRARAEALTLSAGVDGVGVAPDAAAMRTAATSTEAALLQASVPATPQTVGTSSPVSVPTPPSLAVSEAGLPAVPAAVLHPASRPGSASRSHDSRPRSASSSLCGSDVDHRRQRVRSGHTTTRGRPLGGSTANGGSSRFRAVTPPALPPQPAHHHRATTSGAVRHRTRQRRPKSHTRPHDSRVAAGRRQLAAKGLPKPSPVQGSGGQPLAAGRSAGHTARRLADRREALEAAQRRLQHVRTQLRRDRRVLHKVEHRQVDLKRKFRDSVVLLKDVIDKMASASRAGERHLHVSEELWRLVRDYLPWMSMMLAGESPLLAADSGAPLQPHVAAKAAAMLRAAQSVADRRHSGGGGGGGGGVAAAVVPTSLHGPTAATSVAKDVSDPEAADLLNAAALALQALEGEVHAASQHAAADSSVTELAPLTTQIAPVQSTPPPLPPPPASEPPPVAHDEFASPPRRGGASNGVDEPTARHAPLLSAPPPQGSVVVPASKVQSVPPAHKTASSTPAHRSTGTPTNREPGSAADPDLSVAALSAEKAKRAAQFKPNIVPGASSDEVLQRELARFADWQRKHAAAAHKAPGATPPTARPPLRGRAAAAAAAAAPAAAPRPLAGSASVPDAWTATQPAEDFLAAAFPNTARRPLLPSPTTPRPATRAPARPRKQSSLNRAMDELSALSATALSYQV